MSVPMTARCRQPLPTQACTGDDGCPSSAPKVHADSMNVASAPASMRYSRQWRTALTGAGTRRCAQPYGRERLQAADDQRRPAGLMARTSAPAGVPVKVFVKEDEAAPVRV